MRGPTQEGRGNLPHGDHVGDLAPTSRRPASIVPLSGGAVNLIIEAKHTELEDLCRRFGVERLSLFGSAVTGRFRPASSDLDFIVEMTDRGPNAAYADVTSGSRRRWRTSSTGESTSSRNSPFGTPTSAGKWTRPGNRSMDRRRARGLRSVSTLGLPNTG